MEKSEREEKAREGKKREEKRRDEGHIKKRNKRGERTNERRESIEAGRVDSGKK